MDSETLTFLVAFVAFDIVFFAVVIYLWQRNKKAHEARAAMCEQEGWGYLRPGGRTRFQIEGKSPTGHSWVLKVLKRRRGGGSGTSSSKGTFLWKAALPEPPAGMVLLGPHIPAIGGMDFGGMVAQFLLKMIFGDDASEFSDLRQIELGEAAIEDQWMVLATDEDQARRFVSGPTLMALQEHPEDESPPVVMYWKNGLELRIMETVSDPERLRALARFGEFLLTTTDQAVDAD